MPNNTIQERGLGGAVEAALNHCMANEEWLKALAKDPNIKQNTPAQVYQTLEEYITEVLALKTNNQ